MAKIDFFISFNRADRSAADLVYETVTGAGYTCFYQHQDIPDGADFVQRMTDGLQEASTVLALFSPSYFESKYALAELHAAFADDPLNERRSILPILVAEYKIPKPFNALVLVDCRNLDAGGLQSKLSSALAQYGRPAEKPAESRIPETNTAAAAQKLVDDLEVAYTIFLSQCEVRNALVDAIHERDSSFELAEYEPFIARYYAEMTPAERKLHGQIREQTDTIEKLNRRALYYIEASKEFAREIPQLEELREHLKAWLEKYDRTFESDSSVGVLYVGVIEGKPFPPGIETAIRRYIDRKRASVGVERSLAYPTRSTGAT
jgi:hypothetical protein